MGSLRGLRTVVAVVAVTSVLAACSARSGHGSPRTLATVRAGSRGTATGAPLFTTVRRLGFGSLGPNANLVGLDASSLFLTGAFTNTHGSRVTLIEVSRRSFTVTASADLPDLTSVSYGLGAVWWATGRSEFSTGCNCAPPQPSRLLLRVDPTSLRITARFTLPAAPQLVAVAGGQLWAATAHLLLHLDPETGRVRQAVPVAEQPVSLATASDGSRLYLLAAGHPAGVTLTAYDPATGQLLGHRQDSGFSNGPLAPSSTGVWVPIQHPRTSTAVIRLFNGPTLTPSAQLRPASYATVPYVVNEQLWLIDSWGQAQTVCANVTTGATLATGPPVGIEVSAMISDSGGVYLADDVGVHDSLMQIRPNPAC